MLYTLNLYTVLYVNYISTQPKKKRAALPKVMPLPQGCPHPIIVKHKNPKFCSPCVSMQSPQDLKFS